MKLRKGMTSLTVLLSIYLVLIFMSSVASASPGHAGVLYVGENAVEDTYEVIPEHSYDLHIEGLPDEVGPGLVNIRVGGTTFTGVAVSGGITASFQWTCPSDATYGTVYNVHVRDPDGDPKDEIIVGGTLVPVAYLFVIPEVAFGTGMSLVVFLGSLALFSTSKRWRLRKKFASITE